MCVKGGDEGIVKAYCVPSALSGGSGGTMGRPGRIRENIWWACDWDTEEFGGRLTIWAFSEATGLGRMLITVIVVLLRNLVTGLCC
jgi:hypothetical protein